MTDLWTEASLDHESLAREAALARAEAEFAGVFPFLAAARTDSEYRHRRALAEERLVSIALQHGVEPDEILKMADRRYALLKEALPEEVNPLAWVPDGGQYGSGAEEPYEHDEGPDFSHGYAEVPQGAPGGPDPRVVTPVPPQAGPVQETTAGRHRREGKHRREADAGNEPGIPQAAPAPGMTAAPAAPVAAGVQPDSGSTPLTPPGIGQVTSTTDRVRRQVMAVTASIQASNPAISDADAGRLARKVVGQYLRPTADLSSSVIGDDPQGGQEGGGESGGGGMNGMEKAMMGRTLINAVPDIAEALL